MVSNLIEITEN